MLTTLLLITEGPKRDRQRELQPRLAGDASDMKDSEWNLASKLYTILHVSGCSTAMLEIPQIILVMECILDCVIIVNFGKCFLWSKGAE